jgi:hypothetical protein
MMVLLLSLVVAVPEAQAATRSLTVTKSGLQQGTVTSDPAGINCGSDCTESYPEECLVENQHGVCTLFGPAYVTLTTTVPSGFVPTWSMATCDEGTQTGTSCTVPANNNTVNVHYDDTSPPAVSLTSPSAGFKRGTITLAASASDLQTGVGRVEFLVRGSVVATDSSAPYSVSYNTSAVSDGAAQVVARAFNSDGDSAQSSAVTITIDNTAPAVNITSGPDGETFGANSTQTWQFSATDATSGISAVHCSVVAQGSPDSFGSCTGANSHSVTNRSGGTYTFKVRATDSTGNQSTQERSFSIDATAPTVVDWTPKGKKASRRSKPTVMFSEPMEAGSLEAADTEGRPTTFVLKKGTRTISATVSYVENQDTGTYKVVLTPSARLKPGVTYTATLTTTATDAAGNPLTQDPNAPDGVAKTWRFTVKR